MIAPLLFFLRLSMASALITGAARAESVLIAVAANFSGAADEIASAFARDTGHEAKLTTGATGKLYAQISEGAPFEILLSADAATPARLVAEGLAVDGASFTYAIGKLSLWSVDPGRIGPDGQAAVADPDLRFLAIANPDLAPYGAAARDVLQAWSLWDPLQGRIVQGQNIGQTFGLVQSGAAEIGFVAQSALDAPGLSVGGSRWDVPQALYTPLLQDAALLTIGADNPAAQAFMTYLAGPEARAIITRYGYGVAQ